MSIIDVFLNKNVLVESSNQKIEGKLVHYEPSDKESHRPFTLILKTQGRFLVLRNWSVLKELKRNESS